MDRGISIDWIWLIFGPLFDTSEDGGVTHSMLDCTYYSTILFPSDKNVVTSDSLREPLTWRSCPDFIADILDSIEHQSKIFCFSWNWCLMPKTTSLIHKFIKIKNCSKKCLFFSYCFHDSNSKCDVSWEPLSG